MAVFLFLALLFISGTFTQYVHQAAYSSESCFGDSFSVVGLRVETCIPSLAGISAFRISCIGDNIIRDFYDNDLCLGNSTGTINTTVGECASNGDPIFAAILPITACNVPLLPLDVNPPTFPNTEGNLPTVTLQVFPTNLSSCENNEQPTIVSWFRNGGCAVNSRDGTTLISSIYNCNSEDNTVLQNDFSDTSCQNPSQTFIFSNQACALVIPRVTTSASCLGGDQSNSGNDSNNIIIISVIIPTFFCFFVVISLVIIGLILRRKNQSLIEKEKFFKENEIKLLKDVKIERIIGTGAFGEVYQGTWERIDIALKSLKDQDVSDFVNELKILESLRHPNILVFYGIYHSEGIDYMVTEYMDRGDLLSVLRNDIEITLYQLVQASFKSASGLAYLHENDIIHRDLAARNILVSEVNDLIFKVADFGLSRRVEDYYITESKKIPVRWTAPEAIRTHKYNKATDVYSYGIVLWEIFSRGSVPYPGLSNSEVVKQSSKGLRPIHPHGTPNFIGELMSKCWHNKPEKRPSMKKVESFFNEQNISSIEKLSNSKVVSLGDPSSESSDPNRITCPHCKNELDVKKLVSEQKKKKETSKNYGMTPSRVGDTVSIGTGTEAPEIENDHYLPVSIGNPNDKTKNYDLNSENDNEQEKTKYYDLKNENGNEQETTSSISRNKPSIHDTLLTDESSPREKN